MDTEISKLRRLNLIAGVLHLVSLVGIIALSNDAAMPVRATYLTDAPTLDAFSDPVHLFNLNISWMIGAFLALSAFFHFLIISPKFFPRYSAGLASRHNYFRWVEYSLSSSLMIVVILQLNGVADYIALSGMFGVNTNDSVWMAARAVRKTRKWRHVAVLLWLHCRNCSVDHDCHQHTFAKWPN
jgi:hypothetical protein